MHARVAALGLLVATAGLAAGCLADQPEVTPPDSGPFVTVWWTCGFVPHGTICTHWQLDADGTLVAFEGNWSEGDGSIHADEGALYNVTRHEVRSILDTVDLYNASRNYTAYLAYRGHATEAEIGTLLAPAYTFYETQRHYDDPTIADAGTLNIEVTSDRGTHVSSAYTGDGADAFDEIREAFWSVRDAVEQRLGVPSQR